MNAIGLRPAAAAATTVPGLMLERARRQPDRAAFKVRVDGRWQAVTWADYRTAVMRLALGLHDLGLRHGDRIVIHAENRPEWLYADLAAESLGAVVAGAYPSSSAADLRQLLQDSGARILVTEGAAFAAKARDVAADCPGLAHILAIDAVPGLATLADLDARGAAVAAAQPGLYETLVAHVRPDDISCIIYTSGTTGAPKGAMLSHRNAIAGAIGMAEGLGLDDGDVTIAYLPLCHLAEKNLTLYVSPLIGHVVHFASSPQAIQAEVAELRPTFLGAVPRVAQKMVAGVEAGIAAAGPLARWHYRLWMAIGRGVLARRIRRGYRLQGLDRLLFALGSALVYRGIARRLGLGHARHCIIGTAPVPPAVMEYFHVIGVPFRQTYGQTEAGGATHMSRLDDLRFDTIGPAAPGYDWKIDPASGEVLIRGDAVFAGYWNQPEATAATLRGGWLHTGDIGEMTPERHLRIVGRIKDIIITAGGKNISPALIEAPLRATPFIKEAVVVGEGRPYLTALILPDYDRLRAHLGQGGATNAALADNPAVIALIQAAVDAVNADLARVGAIKKFRLLPRELGSAPGEMTVTQKLRRQAVVGNFAALVEEMYA